MRLPVSYVEYLAKRIITVLHDEGYILAANPQNAQEAIREAILEDFEAEAELDEEVLDILEENIAKLPPKERGQIDVDRMFNMIKRQLANERNIIL